MVCLRSLSRVPIGVVFIFLQTFTVSAFAAGFQLDEISPGLQGAATAGAAAADNDVSSMFTNPATLATLRENQLYLGGSVITPKASMSDARAIHRVNIPGSPPSNITAPVLGNTSQASVGNWAIVPDAFLGWRINNQIVAGVAITSPIGLATDYDRDSVVRFAAQESSLVTLNINPAVAMKFNEQWAGGLGFQAQYAQAVFSNFNGPYTGIPQIDGLIAAEFPTRLRAHGWGFGFNTGLLYKPSACTRLGVGYRSQIVQSLGGNGKQYTSPGPTVPAPSHTFLFNAVTSVNGSVPLPPVLTLSAAQDINEWTLKASAQLNFWNSFKHLSINMPDAFGINSTIQAHWVNAWLYAVGADYRATRQWTLRAGVAYDETPTRDHYRDPRIPDTDRVWATAGFTYQLMKTISIDGAYEHIFGQAQTVNVTQASGSSRTSTVPLEVNKVNARYKLSADIVALAIRINFC